MTTKYLTALLYLLINCFKLVLTAALDGKLLERGYTIALYKIIFVFKVLFVLKEEDILRI